MQLDIEHFESLVQYLRTTGRIGPRESPLMRNLTGGVSCRTVWVQRPGGAAWVLKQALGKLRVQADWFSAPERIHREALALRRLSHLSVPAFVFEDFEQHVLAMQAVPEPHQNWKTLLLAGDLRRDHVEQFAHLLARVHQVPHDAAFDDRSFFESLRLEAYYGYAAEQVLPASAFLHELVQDTRATRTALVHGDFSPKNILIHHDRLVLLDQEVVHWGDPAFDVGFSLTHLLSKARHLRRPDYADAARWHWHTYQNAGGPADESHAVRHTLGCMLARVAGRSPLEYLDDDERARQRDCVLQQIETPPRTIVDLIHRTTDRI